MARRLIECDTCNFEGSLSYKDGIFGRADISFCPACGGDISEEYNDEEIEDDEDLQ